MNEHRVHQIFEVSLLLKGAHALIECVGRIVLAFVSTNAIVSRANSLTQEEFVEDPSCGIWQKRLIDERMSSADLTQR